MTDDTSSISKYDGARRLFDSIHGDPIGSRYERMILKAADQAVSDFSISEDEQQLLRDSVKAVEAGMARIRRLDRETALAIVSAMEGATFIAGYLHPGDEAWKIINDAARSQQGRGGGKASGEARRKSRPWVERAKELAKQARSHDPSLSQDNVVLEIVAQWKSKRPRCRVPRVGPPTLRLDRGVATSMPDGPAPITLFSNQLPWPVWGAEE